MTRPSRTISLALLGVSLALGTAACPRPKMPSGPPPEYEEPPPPSWLVDADASAQPDAAGEPEPAAPIAAPAPEKAPENEN